MINLEDVIVIAFFALSLIFLLVLAAVFLLIFRVWLRALLTGAPVSVINILTMRLRGSPPMLLVDAYSALRRAGVAITIGEVEAAYLDNRTRVRTSQDLISLVKSRAQPN